MNNVYWEIWNKNNPKDKIKSGDSYVIHHIDGNHNNNNISNLRKMFYADHTYLHKTDELLLVLDFDKKCIRKNRLRK